MQRILIAILSLSNAVIIFVFIDGLAAVGRFDAGVKWAILQLPYLSIILSISVIFLLKRRKTAIIAVSIALLLFLPLFAHECLPGVIGLIDPNYISSGDGTDIVPFSRIEPLAFAVIAIFAGEIFTLCVKTPQA